MQKYFTALLALFCLFAGAGCTTTRVADPNVRPIRLGRSEFRQPGGKMLRFPAGTYKAVFSTSNGTYYRADENLLVSVGGITAVKQGGVFLPFPKSSNQKHGVWFSNEEMAGGRRGLNLGPPTKVFRFAEPLAIHPVDFGEDQSQRSAPL